MGFPLRVAAALLTIVAALSFNGCRERSPVHDASAPQTPMRPIAELIEEHAPRLMSIGGVVGVYEGLTEAGTPCLKIMVVRRTPELEAQLPKSIEGVPVEIDETGEIRPLPGDRK